MLQSLNNSHIVRFCNLHLKQFPTFLEMALYTTSKINRWFLYMASKFHLCIYTCAWILCDRPTVSNCFCSILHLLISISLHFIAQLIIKCTHTRTCICACRPLMHAHIRTHKRTHTRAHTHTLSSVWWGVWTAPTDCASLPLCSGVPVVPSPIAVNATIWCATWTS